MPATPRRERRRSRGNRSRIPLSLFHPHVQVPRGFTAQGDFGAIYLEDARIAARRTAAGCDASAGQEPEFHETAGLLGGEVDAVENRGVSAAQFHQGGQRLGLLLVALSCNIDLVCGTPKLLSRPRRALFPRCFRTLLQL